MKFLPRTLAVIAAVLLSAAADPGGVAPGSIAPDAAGIVLQGPPGTRLSALRGKVVVLDFWASWCGPCRQSQPELNTLREELHKAGYAERFEVLGVSVDSEVKLARRFLEKTPVSYPQIVDQIGIASTRFNLWRLPATFLVEPDGRVNYIYWGYGDSFAVDLKQRVLALLALPA